MFYLSQAINIFLIFIYVFICVYRAVDLPPLWPWPDFMLPEHAQDLCSPFVPSAQGCGGIKLLPYMQNMLPHPRLASLPVNGQDPQGQDTLAVTRSGRNKGID